MMRRSKEEKQVVLLANAAREAKELLTLPQYMHIKGVVQRLRHFGNDAQLSDLDIVPAGPFYQLQLSGYILGNTSLRMFFANRVNYGEIVVLKTCENALETRVSRHIILNIEDRMEDYEAYQAALRSTVYRR